MNKIYLVIEIRFNIDDQGISWAGDLSIGEPVCWSSDYNEIQAHCDLLNQETFRGECDTIYQYGGLADIYDSDLLEADFLEKYKNAILSVSPIAFDPEADDEVLNEIYTHLYIPYFGVRSLHHLKDLDELMKMQAEKYQDRVITKTQEDTG